MLAGAPCALLPSRPADRPRGALLTGPCAGHAAAPARIPVLTAFADVRCAEANDPARLAVAALAVPCRARPRRRSRSSRRPARRRSTATGRRAATCSTARGCCATTPATSESARSCRATRRRRLDEGDGPERVERTATTSSTSFAGGVGWYRKDFRCPARPRRLTWIVALRVGQLPRRRSWLNGHVDRDATGRLPAVRVRACRAAASSAGASNRLVVRVDNRRPPTDFPPSGLSVDRRADRRLVELRRHPARGLPARRSTTSTSHASRCRPTCPCATCAATIDATRHACATTPADAQPRHRRAARFGTQRRRRSARVASARGASVTFTKQRHASQKPRLWSPDRPNLYDAHAASGRSARARRVQALHAAAPASARSRSSAAACCSTAAPLNFRGVGLHEDSQTKGFAIDNAHARAGARARSRTLGATLIRAHYPLHPVHPGAGRPARDHDLVRGAGLLGQDEVPRSRSSCASSRPRSCARTSRSTRTTRR